MQTDDVGTLTANNFAAIRVSKDLNNRSNFGAIAVNRQATGDNAGSNNWNRTFGADGRYGIGEAVTLSGFAARTQTPGADQGQYAYNGAFDFRNRKYEAQANYAEVADDFDPQVGFLERTDGYRSVGGAFRRHVRTPTLDQTRPPRVGTTRQLRELLRIRRPARNRVTAPRQPSRFRKRLFAGVHRAQRPMGRAPRRRSRSTRESSFRRVSIAARTS